MRGSEEGRWKSTHLGNSLAAYPTSRSVLREARGAIPRAYSPKPLDGVVIVAYCRAIELHAGKKPFGPGSR